MGASEMPKAEVAIDEPLVRGLLEAQRPDLASLDLAPLANGWDNVLFRLGDERVVRLPRRAMAASLVEHEARWLPELAPRLPLLVPVPEHLGEPSATYPWHWTIGPWFEGAMAATSTLVDEADAARTIGGFLRALHLPAPDDAPPNPYRGTPLLDRDGPTRDRIVQLDGVVDAAAITRAWDAALSVPDATGAPVWLHGDLHPANLVVRDGGIVAAIDFGDITAGDRATDLSVAWMLFDAPARRVLRDEAGGVDDHTWDRARGWALALALAYLASSADNAVMAAVGHATLDRIFRDPATR